MFENDYIFRGTHAIKVKQLTTPFNDKSTFVIFDRNVDVYLLAPVIGFLYNRIASEDKIDNIERKILAAQMISNAKAMEYTYKLILLLDSDHGKTIEDRINMAFRNYKTSSGKNDEILFDTYVRGGIDILYEKIIENAQNEEDYIHNLQDFLDDFHERYSDILEINSSYDLVEMARD